MSTASLSPAVLGSDVPLVVTYEDDSNVATDPDDTDADTTADATITIRKEDADTPVVDNAAMTRLGTGSFEYVWDSSTNEDGTGRYQVDVSAVFGGETKITRVTVPLR